MGVFMLLFQSNISQWIHKLQAPYLSQINANYLVYQISKNIVIIKTFNVWKEQGSFFKFQNLAPLKHEITGPHSRRRRRIIASSMEKVLLRRETPSDHWKWSVTCPILSIAFSPPSGPLDWLNWHLNRSNLPLGFDS